MTLLGKLCKQVRRMWYGDVPQHEGWGDEELTPIVAEVSRAQERLHQCGNVTCYQRPMNGSIFCWDCMCKPAPVQCVKFSGAELAPRNGYGGKFVIALYVLEAITTLRFTKLEVMYSIAFDAMLLGSGRHQYVA
jgi:hypothetical protein